jgi:hypothetical protein
MSETKTLHQYDTDQISALLTGRRIVAVEQGEFKRPDQSWGNQATGKLSLDDGTHIFVAPNEGCGGCSSGWYALASLASVANVITAVRVDDETAEPGGDVHKYRIYVVADAVEINALQVNGDDGNGYYGTGYELIVVLP